jgi:hypothetical protein
VQYTGLNGTLPTPSATFLNSIATLYVHAGLQSLTTSARVAISHG